MIEEMMKLDPLVMKVPSFFFFLHLGPKDMSFPDWAYCGIQSQRLIFCILTCFEFCRICLRTISNINLCLNTSNEFAIDNDGFERFSDCKSFYKNFNLVNAIQIFSLPS